MLNRTLKTAAFVSVLAALTTGCAGQQGMGSQHSPIVDMKRVDYINYKRDVNDCQSYARQAMGAGEGAAAGAIGGALLGAALGAIIGDTSMAARQVAAVAAITAGIGGGVKAETDQRAIINRCMAGRGYRVLSS